MRPWEPRIGAPRLLKPLDRLVGARLQQMNHANPPVQIADAGIARAEPDRLLLRHDRAFDRTGQKFAVPQRSQCEDRVPVERDRGFILKNGRIVSLLGTQNLAFDQVGKRMPRQCGQRFVDKLLRAVEIPFGRLGDLLQDPAGKRMRQEAPRADRAGIEAERCFEQPNGFRKIVR